MEFEQIGQANAVGFVARRSRQEFSLEVSVTRFAFQASRCFVCGSIGVGWRGWAVEPGDSVGTVR